MSFLWPSTRKAEVRIERMERSLGLGGGNTRETRSRRGKIDARLSDIETLKKDLLEYKSEIFPDDNKCFLHPKGWDACEAHGCGKRVQIEGSSYKFLHWKCKKGDCKLCQGNSWSSPRFESIHVDGEEMIKYSLFARMAMCTVTGHGANHIQQFDEKPKLICRLCE